MPSNNTQITPPRVPLTDERTGAVSREWYRWFYNLYTITGEGSGVTPVINGGTGLSTIPTNGQLLIGNGTGYTLNTLGYGAGITVTNAAGAITVANSGVLSNIAGAGISVSSATGNVTINNTGVLSWSGGTTGLTPSSATTGAVTLAGTLAIANGGTNGSAAPTAYGVAYGTGTAYAFTAAGTTKQVLIANTSAAPTWSTLTTGTSILYGDGSGGFSNVTIGSGVSFVGGTLSATGSGGTVTSVTGTSPVVSSGGTTPAISLAAAYGDTLNPYASKTANYVLAAPNASAGVPTFRALVAADVPGSALTKTDDTNVTLTLGGSPTTALLNAASLTLGWTGQLGISRGGTNTSVAPSAYGVVYGNSGGTAYTSLTNGTTGQILTATTGGAPTWANPATNGTVTSVAATVPAFLSITGSPITTSGTLAITYSGTALPVANGGTGLTAGTSGGLLYYSATGTLASSALLTQYGVVYGGGAGAAPVSTAAGTTGQVLTATTGGAPTWANPATNGTVTSVSFTGGIITVATATTTPALTVAGTSGGIPYFSSASTWASSAALAANAIVIGGGAGAAPATTTTGTGVVTALGVNTGTAGAFVVNGGALGTPSSGTVTNLTGTASININGTVGATTANTGAFTTLSATGVTTVQAGTAAAPAITTSGDTNTGVFFPAADTIAFTEGGAEAVRINSSGNLLIGYTADQGSGKLQVNGAGRIGAFDFNTDDITYGGGGNFQIGTVFGVPMLFKTDATERMRITSAGLVGIGTTSPNASALLDVQSTTKGVRMPNMTTTQKNAISSPAAGLMVFDTTLAKLCVYSGAAWQTITSI